MDHSFSGKDTLTVREFYDGFFMPAYYNPESLLNAKSADPIISNSILAHETHIFRPNLLNDLRASYSRVSAGSDPPAGSPGRDFGVSIPFQPPVANIQNLMVPGFFSFSITPHRTVISYVWQLPKLLHASRPVRALLDWQTTGIVTVQTGGPLTILAGNNASQTGNATERAVVTGTPYGPGACKNSRRAWTT